MFRKRKKQVFPPNTFIPTPARVMAIIQLCIVFTVLFSTMGYPFMGELFANKSSLLLYDNVIGRNIENSSDYHPDLHRNAQRFADLSVVQKEQILQQYQVLQAQNQTSFLTKLKHSFFLLFKMPTLKLAWLVLSITISILLLKRVEGAVQAVWLLPLLALAFAVDNRWHGTPIENTEETLFPSEALIVENYLETPLGSSIIEQEKQLREGWKLYLIREWTKETPSSKTEVFDRQVEDGEFAFNVARIEARTKDQKLQKAKASFQMKEPVSLLLLYVGWNLCFACIVMWTFSCAFSRSVLKLSD